MTATLGPCMSGGTQTPARDLRSRGALRTSSEFRTNGRIRKQRRVCLGVSAGGGAGVGAEADGDGCTEIQRGRSPRTPAVTVLSPGVTGHNGEDSTGPSDPAQPLSSWDVLHTRPRWLPPKHDLVSAGPASSGTLGRPGESPSHARPSTCCAALSETGRRRTVF